MRTAPSTQILRALKEPLAALTILFVLLQALLGSLGAAAMAGAAADPLSPHAVRCLAFAGSTDRSAPVESDVPACCTALCGMLCGTGAALTGPDVTVGPTVTRTLARPAASVLPAARPASDYRLAQPRAPPSVSLSS